MDLSETRAQVDGPPMHLTLLELLKGGDKMMIRRATTGEGEPRIPEFHYHPVCNMVNDGDLAL